MSVCVFISLFGSGSTRSLVSVCKELGMNSSRIGGSQLVQSLLSQLLWQPSHVGIGFMGKSDVGAREQQL